MRSLTMDPRPAKASWAPGSYFNICLSCEQEFIGDKRALSCAECAYRNGWRRMETAPKDGTRILIWDPNDDDGETYKIAYWGPKPYPTGWTFRGGWLAADEPDGWRPLPVPPPESADTGGEAVQPVSEEPK